MDFFKNLGKRSDKNKEKQETKRKQKKIHNKAGNLKQYPNVKALQLPEMTPSSVLDQLRTYASEKSGLVRKFDNGYLVLMFTDDDMARAGLKPSKNQASDFGQLAASFRADSTIHSATLAANAMEGQVVIIPDADTLDSLEDFECFNPNDSDGDELITFHYGLFPLKADDDDDDVQVQMLNSTIKSGDWKPVINGTMDVRFDDGKGKVMFVPVTKDGTEITDEGVVNAKSTDDTLSEDDKQEIKKQAEDIMNKVVPDVTDASDQTQADNSSNEKTINNDDDDASNQSSDSDKVQDDKPSDSSDDIDLARQGDVFANLARGVVEHSNKDQVEHSISAKAYSAASVKDNKDDEKPVQLKRAPAVNDEDDQSEKSRIAKANQITSKDAIKAFNTKMGLSMLESSKDAEFGITVDTHSINNYLHDIQPYQFELDHVDKDDSLAKMINQHKESANAHLKSENAKIINLASTEYIDRITNVLEELHDMFSLDNPDSQFTQAMEAENKEYNDKLQHIDEAIQEQIGDNNKEYEIRKAQYVASRTSNLEQSYDENNRGELEARNDDVRDQYLADVDVTHQRRVNEIVRKRNRYVKEVFHEFEPKIYNSVVENVQRRQNSVREMFHGYEESINQLARSNYDKDVERQKAMANRKNFEQEINDLKATNDALRQQNEKITAQYEKRIDDDTARHNKRVVQLTDDNREQVKAIQDSFESRLTKLSNDYKEREAHLQSELKSTKEKLESFEDNKRQEIKDVTDRYEDQIRSLKQQEHDKVDNMKSKFDHDLNQIDANNRKKKHHTWVAVLVSILVSAGVSVPFGMLVEHNTNPNPPQEQVSHTKTHNNTSDTNKTK